MGAGGGEKEQEKANEREGREGERAEREKRREKETKEEEEEEKKIPGGLFQPLTKSKQNKNWGHGPGCSHLKF